MLLIFKTLENSLFTETLTVTLLTTETRGPIGVLPQTNGALGWFSDLPTLKVGMGVETPPFSPISNLTTNNQLLN